MWTDRNLARTRFVRCKLGGAHGKPTSADGLAVVDCDVDLATFVAQLHRGVE